MEILRCLCRLELKHHFIGFSQRKKSVFYQITESINAIRILYTREMGMSWFREPFTFYWYRLPVLLGQLYHLNYMERTTDKWAFIRKATDHLFAVYLLILRIYRMYVRVKLFQNFDWMRLVCCLTPENIVIIIFCVLWRIWVDFDHEYSKILLEVQML